MAEEEEPGLSMTSSSLGNLTVNPFETASLDSMHLPAFSPSVFRASQETPCSTRKKSGFRWSIDQMSLLFPADIDELPRQQEVSLLSREKEEEVQEAINQFFSQKEVAPSPWSEARSIKHVTFSPGPPSMSVLSEHSAENSVCSSTNGSFVGSVSGKVDVSCQTKITLPMNFDLEALLGKGRFVYTKSSVESFPVAPLRRKLFVQSESSSARSDGSAGCENQHDHGHVIAGSPGLDNRESGPFSPSISPIKSSQEYGACSSPLPPPRTPRTPSSLESQFSSSPIVKATPSRVPHIPYQASPLCGSMESPSMSPIKDIPHQTGPLSAKKNLLSSSVNPHDGEPLESGMDTSALIFKDGREDESQIEEDEHEEEEEGERRKNFTLGLARDFSPIQKSGDQISLVHARGCSSRLHGTAEESSMDTSLLSSKADVIGPLEASPSSPREERDGHRYFSLEASTAPSPIPKTSYHHPHQDQQHRHHDIDHHQHHRDQGHISHNHQQHHQHHHQHHDEASTGPSLVPKTDDHHHQYRHHRHRDNDHYDGENYHQHHDREARSSLSPIPKASEHHQDDHYHQHPHHHHHRHNHKDDDQHHHHPEQEVCSPIPKSNDREQGNLGSESQSGGDGGMLQSLGREGFGLAKKTVSFHIGTDFSPIRGGESGEEQIVSHRVVPITSSRVHASADFSSEASKERHLNRLTVPITSSRVHESTSESVMDTSLLSLNGRREADALSSRKSPFREEESGKIFAREPENAGLSGCQRDWKVVQETSLENGEPGLVRTSTRNNLRELSLPPEDVSEVTDENASCGTSPLNIDRNRAKILSHGHNKQVAMPNEIRSEDHHVLKGTPNSEMRNSRDPRLLTSTHSSPSELHNPGKAYSSLDMNSPLVQPGHCRSDTWPPHGLAFSVTKNPLTSTMRYGTPSGTNPFRFLPGSGDRDSTATMEISSVSLIEKDDEEKQIHGDYSGDGNPADSDHGVMNIPAHSSKHADQRRTASFTGYDFFDGNAMQGFPPHNAPSRMSVSRSYDSLRKFAEEKENTPVMEDWLMSSFSESDLQDGRMSCDELQPRHETGDLHFRPFIQNVQHRKVLCELQERGRSRMQHGSTQFKEESSDTTHRDDQEFGENKHNDRQDFSENMHHGCHGLGGMNQHDLLGIHSSHPVTGPPRGFMQQGHIQSNLPEGHKSHLTRGGLEFSPARPLSADLLPHVLKDQVDSGYNTRSNNVSLDVVDMDAVS